MLTILLLLGVLALGIGSVAWWEVRQRHRRDAEAQQMTRSVERQAQREIAAADYAKFKKPNGHRR